LDEDALRSELEQVTAELAATRVQYASIGAKVAGLEAQQQALTRALTPQGRAADSTQPAVPRYRTDAIVAILEASGTEMSIQDVIGVLADAGRPSETAGNVGVDLAYLADRGRVNRVRRGIYAATSLRSASTASLTSAERTSRSRPLLRRQQGGTQ
jgi:hypothetical protein